MKKIFLSLLFFPFFAFAQEEKLDNITVYGASSKASIKDSIIKTNVISGKEIEKLNAQNLNQAIDNNPGISVQTECSICNVRNVSLNNMPGRFTTLMIDGVPIFSSVSTAYGIDSINVKGIESVEVARGAGASLIAPEALSGTVNIITKRPTKTELEIKADGGIYNGSHDNNFAKNASIYYATPFDGGAANLSFLYQQHDPVDTTGAGITQFAGFERMILGGGYFLDDVAGFKVKGRVDVVNEDRNGGTLGDNFELMKRDRSGNPFDFRRITKGSSAKNGWEAPDGSGFVEYDSGLAGMSEIILTDRIQLINSGTKNTDYGKIKIAGAYANHKQDSFYETTLYKASQNQYYGLLSDEIDLSSNSSLTIGSDFRYEDLKSFNQNPDGSRNDGIDNYKYYTHGFFAQLYNQFFDQKLETNISARLDHHNVFGNIFVPRANALFHHNDNLSSRVSAGIGYRAPTSFFEQEHGIIETARIIREINDPEKSQNFSYSLNYANDRIDSTLSYNYNKIDNFAMLDAGAQRNGQDITLFSSAQNPVIIQGIDLNIDYKITPSLSANVGYERFFYRFQPGTLLFSRPDQKAYFGLDYEKDNFDIFTRVNWTGNQNLKKFYDYENNPRYNFDGTKKRDESPSFFTVDLGAQYALNKNFSIYSNITNLFDYLQADHDSQLWIDSAGELDTTHIWGPNMGRHFYLGAKYSF